MRAEPSLQDQLPFELSRTDFFPVPTRPLACLKRKRREHTRELEKNGEEKERRTSLRTRESKQKRNSSAPYSAPPPTYVSHAGRRMDRGLRVLLSFSLSPREQACISQVVCRMCRDRSLFPSPSPFFSFVFSSLDLSLSARSFAVLWEREQAKRFASRERSFSSSRGPHGRGPPSFLQKGGEIPQRLRGSSSKLLELSSVIQTSSPLTSLVTFNFLEAHEKHFDCFCFSQSLPNIPRVRAPRCMYTSLRFLLGFSASSISSPRSLEEKRFAAQKRTENREKEKEAESGSSPGCVVCGSSKATLFTRPLVSKLV